MELNDILKFENGKLSVREDIEPSFAVKLLLNKANEEFTAIQQTQIPIKEVLFVAAVQAIGKIEQAISEFSLITHKIKDEATKHLEDKEKIAEIQAATETTE